VRVAVTGATGLIGSRLVARLLERGDEVTVLSRDPQEATVELGPVTAVAWEPSFEPAPAEALAGREGVVHLAGENIAQRWSDPAKERIRTSRELGTRNLVTGLRAADPRPSVLVSASGIDYYGPHGDEELDETAPGGRGFLAETVEAWEREARAAEDLGMRTVQVRTAVVLAPSGGALARMLPPFRAGVGGPVAGGRQYMPWIHLDDLVGIYVTALDDRAWSGAINAAAPDPVTNREFSRALGRVLHRPAIAPVPGFALRLLYGEMAEVVTTGQRAVPRRLLELGYRFRHPDLDEALASALR
jgi:uncharacterized protein